MSNRIGALWVKKIKNGEHAGETMLSGVTGKRKKKIILTI